MEVVTAMADGDRSAYVAVSCVASTVFVVASTVYVVPAVVLSLVTVMLATPLLSVVVV